MAATGSWLLPVACADAARNRHRLRPVSTVAASADDIDRCIADVFEEASAGVMFSKEIRPLAKAWHDGKGLPFDETKLWPRLGQQFKYDLNSNRPRYMGLKLRPKAAGLRLAVSNS